MEKLKHVMWYLFVFIPLVMFWGLGIIMISNQRIITCEFVAKKFANKKQQIDKQKFAKFMKRVCK